MRRGEWINFNLPLKPAIRSSSAPSFTQEYRAAKDVGPEGRYRGAMVALRRLWWGIALLAGLAGLLGGLTSLAVKPLDGVLAVIGGMAAILYAANGFSRGPGVF